MGQVIEKHGKVGRPKGFKMTARSKLNISKSKIGQKHSEATKNKIRDGIIEHFDKSGRRNNPIYKCKGCGEFFKKKQSYHNYSYCNNCLKIYMQNGELGEYHQIYKNLKDKKEYKLWRLKILIRDKFRCRICGKVGECVHHLIDVMKIKDISELLYNIDIGLTLCTCCHAKVHTNIRENRVKEMT